MTSSGVTLFLCGDVMPGRGIDQILAHPSDPQLYEAHARDARVYLHLAETQSGPLPRRVDSAYVWGDALEELGRRRPLARMVNLETSITVSRTPWPKGINYRMHPANAGLIAAAALDVCVLANNHVLDWGLDGLAETLATLQAHGTAVAGAGTTRARAAAPAIVPLDAGGRVLVFAAATEDAGVPEAWAAGPRRAGVHRLADLSEATVADIARRVRRMRKHGDLVIFSIHWGGNWGYGIAPAKRRFAHALIDVAGVDLVHGHSSHHPLALEVHAGHLVLYGCGDFLNDYEGIEGHADYRGELGLMYFPTLDGATGRLQVLDLVPTRVQRFRVQRAGAQDRRWLLERLQREYARFGAGVDTAPGGAFRVRWT